MGVGDAVGGVNPFHALSFAATTGTDQWPSGVGEGPKVGVGVGVDVGTGVENDAKG